MSDRVVRRTDLAGVGISVRVGIRERIRAVTETEISSGRELEERVYSTKQVSKM